MNTKTLIMGIVLPLVFYVILGLLLFIAADPEADERDAN